MKLFIKSRGQTKAFLDKNWRAFVNSGFTIKEKTGGRETILDGNTKKRQMGLNLSKHQL